MTDKERARRRTSKGEATKQTIMDSAARVLATEGLAGFSLDRVATRAGTSTSAIYRYFGNKIDLLQAVALAHREAEAEALAPFPPRVESAATSAVAVELALEAVTAIVGIAPRLAKVLREEVHHDPVVETLVAATDADVARLLKDAVSRPQGKVPWSASAFPVLARVVRQLVEALLEAKHEEKALSTEIRALLLRSLGAARDG
jgi:AcrR family transcriptional regulator